MLSLFIEIIAESFEYLITMTPALLKPKIPVNSLIAFSIFVLKFLQIFHATVNIGLFAESFNLPLKFITKRMSTKRFKH